MSKYKVFSSYYIRVSCCILSSKPDSPLFLFLSLVVEHTLCTLRTRGPRLHRENSLDFKTMNPLQEVARLARSFRAFDLRLLASCEPLLGISLVRFLLASLLACCCAASSNVREFPGVMGVLAYPIMIILFYSQVSESHLTK